MDMKKKEEDIRKIITLLRNAKNEGAEAVVLAFGFGLETANSANIKANTKSA